MQSLSFTARASCSGMLWLELSCCGRNFYGSGKTIFLFSLNYLLIGVGRQRAAKYIPVGLGGRGRAWGQARRTSQLE